MKKVVVILTMVSFIMVGIVGYNPGVCYAKLVKKDIKSSQLNKSNMKDCQELLEMQATGEDWFEITLIVLGTLVVVALSTLYAS